MPPLKKGLGGFNIFKSPLISHGLPAFVGVRLVRTLSL